MEAKIKSTWPLNSRRTQCGESSRTTGTILSQHSSSCLIFLTVSISIWNYVTHLLTSSNPTLSMVSRRKETGISFTTKYPSIEHFLAQSNSSTNVCWINTWSYLLVLEATWRLVALVSLKLNKITTKTGWGCLIEDISLAWKAVSTAVV